ncbi:unnamed protein product [Medioppia subpectinata]|uniref:Uncharacterized protein n=1 Tax=Medioppia subpectinata TaxID=1979941 RepID=A0A7R9KFN4_9ACAR|nr:unnamed protein product [Medioppia subpectinata]CAG2102469.1 unnamed protein product [Medioppia subpectinata]
MYSEPLFRNDISSAGPLDTMVAWVTKFVSHCIRDSRLMNPIVNKPDVIFIDEVVAMASVERSGIPWKWLYDERTPPPGSGLAANGDRKEWAHFRHTVNDAIKDIWREFNDYFVSNGLPPLDYGQYVRQPTHLHIYPLPVELDYTDLRPYVRQPTHLHIYPLPVELDYTDLRPVPDRCLQLDNLMREDVHPTFTLPKQLSNKPSKLIYVDLDLDLMAKLAKYKHWFIVSRGPHHDKYKLPGADMWGPQTVPQIQVLPLVDLVPMVVLPVFGGQFDNAQRLHESGYGIRLDAYRCSEAELLCAIGKLFDGNELKGNYKNTIR